MSEDYARSLKRELFLCHKNMGFSITEIENMPIADRKAYISLHNKSVEEEKQKYESLKRSASTKGMRRVTREA
ncbi:MAG: hypothetical protein LUD72_04420 [Bacteroidales bacterium]|nr:hypothetical protein [Bacteroidales bacterium]